MKVYQFDADIARLYGVDNAVMIWNLQYWIEKNEANGMHFHDGRFWTYNSVDAFSKIFPFWSKGQLRRILKSLEDNDVIITGNYNASAYDRKTWYAFTDSFLQMHLSKSANGSAEIEKCKKDSSINKDIVINYKENTKENTILSIKDNKYNNLENSVERDKGSAEGEGENNLFPEEKTFQPFVVTRPKRTSEKECLFENSCYYDFEKFAAEFKTQEFAGIDIVYYYHAVADWSAQAGKKKRDWIATTRNFIRGDIDKGMLHRVAEPAAPVLSEAEIAYLNAMSD